MNILITGATKGIGKKLAEILSNEHLIFASGRNEEILKTYDNYCKCDLSNTNELKKLGEYIESHNIDVLINNAGEYVYNPIDKVDYSQISRIVSVNLNAPIFLISKAVPYMKQQKWGRIINIGSISGVMGEAGASLYSASKSVLIGGTKAIALELAEYGITVNTINPGWVETEMGNSSAEEGNWSKEEILSTIPERRFITPDEIAGMVRYLISKEAMGVTGQSINICAGLSVGC